MDDNQANNEICSIYQKKMNSELRNRSRVISITMSADRLSQAIVSVLQVVHQNEEMIPSACQKARALLYIARKRFRALMNVPVCSIYKTYDTWCTTIHKYCYLIALTEWLESNNIVSHFVCARTLGLGVTEEEGFYLSIEDYLIGVLHLCSEMVRFAVNLVARREYSRPVQIWKLILNLNSGFGSIDMESEYLAQQYEALQDDVRKIEEVVYDLSLRGLIPSLAENEAAEDASDDAADDASNDAADDASDDAEDDAADDASDA